MAISTAPGCDIRALVMHVNPDGINSYSPVHLTVVVARLGKPVRKLRTMPMGRTHEQARRLQGRFGLRCQWPEFVTLARLSINHDRHHSCCFLAVSCIVE